MTAPSIAGQFHAPVLKICAGRTRIYALAYVGGPIFEIVKEYDCADEALAAFRAATDAIAIPIKSERQK